MTTIDTLHDDQIRTLRREALSAGDVVAVAVCDLALGCADPEALPDELDMTSAQRDHLEMLNLARPNGESLEHNARVEVVRMIQDAEVAS